MPFSRVIGNGLCSSSENWRSALNNSSISNTCGSGVDLVVISTGIIFPLFGGDGRTLASTGGMYGIGFFYAFLGSNLPEGGGAVMSQ